MVIAKFPQYCVVVLAAFGSCGAQARRGSAQFHRLTDEIESAEHRMLDRLRDAEMLDLRIGKDLVNRVDRSARYASTIENIHPVSAVALCRIVLDCGVERITVGGSRRLPCVTRILDELPR